jgi:hypothetical protein
MYLASKIVIWIVNTLYNFTYYDDIISVIKELRCLLVDNLLDKFSSLNYCN